MPAATRFSRISGVQPMVSSTLAYGRWCRGLSSDGSEKSVALIGPACVGGGSRRGRVGRVELELHGKEEPGRHRLAAAGGRAEAERAAPGHGGRVERRVAAPGLDAHRV